MKPHDAWKSFSPEDIPSSLSLFPVLFDYMTPDSRILDLGCGAGRTCAELYNKGYRNVFGTDVNPAAAAETGEKLAALGLPDPAPRFRPCEPASIPFPDGHFNCVLCQSVWTAVLKDDRLPLMKEIERTLKPGGILYIADFARTPQIPLYKERYINGIKRGFDEATFEVTREDGSVKFLAHHYTEEEFTEMFAAAGLRKDYFLSTPVRTHTGNEINGLVIVAVKPA